MGLLDWLGGKKKTNTTPRAAKPSSAPQKHQSPDVAAATVPDPAATKSKIQQIMDAARQRHQLPEFADMVEALVGVETLTNYSTVVEIGLCAAAEHRGCYIGDLKSQYMKCWWHWYEHQMDQRRRADRVIVIAAYPEDYYGELGRHLVNHVHFWLTQGAPDRSDNLRKHLGDIPSRDEIAAYQAAETAQKHAKSSSPPRVVPWASASAADAYQPRARTSKRDNPTQKPMTPSVPQPEAAPTAAPQSGANSQTTRLTISRDFPQEITKAWSREQVSELIRTSARYMWTAIGTYLARDGVKLSDEKTSGVTDPAAASMVFEVSVAATDEPRVTKDVEIHWNDLLRAIKQHGGVDGFCAEYHKERSTPTKFNPHKPICDKCDRDLNPSPLFRVGDHYSGYICKTCKKVLCPGCGPRINCPDCGTKLNDAGLQNLLDLANAKKAAARGEAVIEALALVISPMTGERAEAIEWFDAIASSSATPPYPFDLVVAEGPKIHKTTLICVFDSSKGTPKPPDASTREQFLAWLKTAAGGRTWYTQEAYGPQTYPPGTNLKLEGYFGGIQILRQKRMA